MDVTIAFPHDHPRLPDGGRGVPAQLLGRVPDQRLWNALLGRGVAAQVLIREKEDFFAPPERPIKSRRRIGRGADRARVPAAEGFQFHVRVHVSKRHGPPRSDRLLDLLPGALDVGDGGHLGHGAAGAEVGKEHGLVRPGQHRGGLGHEMDAAEDDVTGLGLGRGLLAQAEGIAAKVAQVHDGLALIVVGEDEELGAEPALVLADSLLKLRLFQEPITVRQK